MRSEARRRGTKRRSKFSRWSNLFLHGLLRVATQTLLIGESSRSELDFWRSCLFPIVYSAHRLNVGEKTRVVTTVDIGGLVYLLEQSARGLEGISIALPHYRTSFGAVVLKPSENVLIKILWSLGVSTGYKLWALGFWILNSERYSFILFEVDGFIVYAGL